VIVSNTPIGWIAKKRDKDSEPATDAYNFLQRIRDKRLPVRIDTSLSTFDSMALQNLSIPRATGRGDELRFTATWLQVATVTNKRTTINTATPDGRGHTTTNKTLDKNYDLYKICPSVNRWYDVNINGWRLYAALQGSKATVTAKSNGQALAGKWLLTKGMPDVSPTELNNYFGPRTGATTKIAKAFGIEVTNMTLQLWNALPETADPGQPSKQDLEAFLSRVRASNANTSEFHSPAVKSVLKTGSAIPGATPLGVTGVYEVDRSQVVVITRTP
jgi:hypothetical protein